MCLLPVVNEASVVNVQYWNSFALFICLGGELQEWRNSMFFLKKKVLVLSLLDVHSGFLSFC